jgi:hypothetical protein
MVERGNGEDIGASIDESAQGSSWRTQEFWEEENR